MNALSMSVNVIPCEFTNDQDSTARHTDPGAKWHKGWFMKEVVLEDGVAFIVAAASDGELLVVNRVRFPNIASFNDEEAISLEPPPESGEASDESQEVHADPPI